ncbi:MAG: hypothetical protein HY698_12775 [Deltaproteobacteria bacterium]|nr:hypothetical protein [Deltaproteobacteria bacterium]
MASLIIPIHLAGGPATAVGGVDVAKTVVSRAGRMVALGPMVGGAAAVGSSGGDFDGGITFGLGLFFFREALFDVGEMKKRIQERVMERLKEKLLERAQRGEPPSKDETEQLTKSLGDEVTTQVRNELAATPSAWPRARFSLLGESEYFAPSGSWQARAGLGIGLGRFFVGPRLAVEFEDKVTAILGIEASTCLLLGKSSRTPVVNVFTRYDFRLHNRDASSDQALVGLRVLLDLI